MITCNRCNVTFDGTRLEILRAGWTSRWHRGLREYTCPKHKAKRRPPQDPEQARRDVAADPNLGKHRDKYLAAQHQTTPHLVRSVREKLGIPAPVRLGAKIEWAKHRTEAT